MDIFALKPQEVGAEKRWWSAMGYGGGAPELIEKQKLGRFFHEQYRQSPEQYFNQNPDLMFDPTLFDEMTAHLRNSPDSLPLLGAPVSSTLKEAAYALWRELEVPGPLEFFVQQGLVDEMRETLGGWDPQAILRIFPEHKDGVVLSSILWWSCVALRESDDYAPAKKHALNRLSPLVHQFEVECALSAQGLRECAAH